MKPEDYPRCKGKKVKIESMEVEEGIVVSRCISGLWLVRVTKPESFEGHNGSGSEDGPFATYSHWFFLCNRLSLASWTQEDV